MSNDLKTGEIKNWKSIITLVVFIITSEYLMHSDISPHAELTLLSIVQILLYCTHFISQYTSLEWFGMPFWTP